jgi:hypothetical protein
LVIQARFGSFGQSCQKLLQQGVQRTGQTLEKDAGNERNTPRSGPKKAPAADG